MEPLQQTIDAAWERRAELDAANAPAPIRDAVDFVIGELDAGRLRVAEKRGSEWVTHQWLKKAVLLSFRLSATVSIGLAGPSVPFRFFDKIPTKFAKYDDAAFAQAGVRVVPLIRYPYKVFYRATSDAVEILYIHQAARRAPWEGE